MNKENAVIDYLTGLIQNKKLQPGDKIPSAAHLAELCSVNRETANKAMSRLVERGWLERRGGAGGTVLRHAPGLCRGAIAYRTTLLSAGYYSAFMMRGAQQAAAERGYVLQYFESPLLPDDEQQRRIASSGVMGVLSTACLRMSPEYRLPCVHLGVGPQEPEVNYFYPDRAAGASRLAELAISLGHQTPALVMGPDHAVYISGIIQAYARHHISIPRSHIFPINQGMDFQPEKFWLEIRKIIPDCSLIFCENDAIAYRMIQYFESHGMKVPRDISVTGFGNQQEYQSLRSITSAEEAPEHIGYRGCLGLIDILEGKINTFQEIYCPDIVRGNTLGQNKEMTPDY